MIADFLFSLAGKKHSDKIDGLIVSLVETDALNHLDARVFEYTLKCSEKGAYPSKDFFAEQGYVPMSLTNSLAEMEVMADNIKDFLLKEKATRATIASINDSTSYKEFLDKLRTISESEVDVDDIDISLFTAEVQSFDEIIADEHAYKVGIAEVDRVTGGLQPGTAACFAAFTGEGKCQSGEHRVFTQRGYIKLKDMLRNYTQGWNNLTDVYCENNKATALFYNPKQPIKIVTLDSGYKLRMTPEHRVRDIKGNLTPVGELKEGDWLYLTQRTPKVEDLDYKKYFFYGMWLGDGSRSIKNNSRELVMMQAGNGNLIRAYKDWEGVNYAISFQEKKHCYTIKIPQHLTKLKDLVDLDDTSYTKYINPEVFTSELKMALVLYGLFVTDGSQYLKCLEYSTTSKALMEDIREICLGFGVNVRVHERMGRYRKDKVYKDTVKNYRIFIRGNSVAHLIKLFKLCDSLLNLESDKHTRLVDRYTSIINYKPVGRKGEIRPCAWDKLFLDNEWLTKLADWRTEDKNHTQFTGYSQLIATLKRFKGFTPASYVRNLILEGSDSLYKEEFKIYAQYQSTQIVSIEDGIEDVFDLNVENTHEYVSSGIEQHNSSLLVSSMFKNVKEGRKGVYFSLEVTPSVVKLQFFARYCYDIHSFTVTPKDIMDSTLSEDEQKRVEELLPQFNEFVKNKLLIVDETLLSEKLFRDYKLIHKLYRAFDKVLGGLDFVGYDHINQIDLMFKDMGNTAIRALTSAGKTFISSTGKCPVTIFCVQVNREGKKRAAKRQGKYDLIAIGDLNECCASFTKLKTHKGNITHSEARKGMILDSVNYDTGKVEPTSIKETFIPGYLPPSEFLQVCWKGEGDLKANYQSAVVSPNHKFYKNGVPCRVDKLKSGDKVDYIRQGLSYPAKQILLGTLIGDSSLKKSDSGQDNYYVSFMAGVAQESYLEWKVSFFKDLVGKRLYTKGSGRSKGVYSYSTKVMHCLRDFIPSKTLKLGDYKQINKDYLNEMDALAWLVWYLDDGCKANYTKDCYSVVFSCTNLGKHGAELVASHLKEKYGFDSSIYISPDNRKTSYKDNIQIRMSSVSSRKFLEWVSPLINVPCVQYKLLECEKKTVVPEINNKEISKESLELSISQYKGSRTKTVKTMGKYAIEVESENKNYLLPGGLITKNCERSVVYALFLFTSDDMKLLQETKVTLLKHRYGAVISEPISVNFNAASFFVGEEIEQTQFDGDFSFLQSDKPVADDNFDDF